ncbi:tail fiber protein [Aliiglaciecola sp. LCG003]|uniref:phage tail protein n=1 Tax=Aliiglaciecola sp. LCG003 TaxID=3053655 RepID=UPI002572EF6B|nr:tail fiber protein [Aliiglaciecola sp. LCG003]WJG10299.1 tail fiber protein [Aliiglaciecola sp. LCG003]
MNIKRKILLILTAISTMFWSNISAANADPFLGEIQYTGANFCPRGWLPAEGQILPINQNQSLYSLLGTTYGGDGRTSFALPDYRGRAIIGPNEQNNLGSKGGNESINLNLQNIHSHTHTATTVTTVNASTKRADNASPSQALLGDDGNDNIYAPGAPDVMMATGSLTTATQIQPTGNNSLNNMQPYLVVTACIATQGQFPSRN